MRLGEQAPLSSRASQLSIFFYGLGNISPAVKNNLLGAPLFYYYNNVLGLEAWLVSLALAISLVADAISDPIIGYMSDYTKGRLGRRHPYILASILPGSICYFLLLSAEFSNNQIGLFAQLLLLVTALRLAWTLYEVPRQALGAEISKDYHQRNQLHGINMLFGWIGGVSIGYLMEAHLLGDSYDNLSGYRELAYWGAAAIFFTGIIFFLGTSRDIPNLEAPRRGPPPTIKQIVRDILDTLNHRSWLVLFFSGVVFSVYVGLTTGLAFYWNSFLWEWKPSDVAIFGVVSFVGAMLISGFAGLLSSRFDKKRLAVGLFSASIVIGPILLVLRLSDLWFGTSLLPPNGEKYGALWWVMLGHGFISANIAILAWILVGSMTADVVEDSQVQTGKRSEGLFFAGPQLVQKAISGLGFVIKGAILTAVGFSVDASFEEKVLSIEYLAAVIVILGVILPGIALYIFSKYEITKDSHQKNLDDLGYTQDSSNQANH